MTRYFLDAISIEGFRGINNQGAPLTLRFKSNSVNSIYAANGAGKSSIFEALYFAIHGHVPRLNALQSSDQGESYIVNKFHPDQTAKIGLLFSTDDGSPSVAITVVRNAEGGRIVSSPTHHQDPEGFLASLREDFVLVDYSQFAKFVDASALERGRSFASLVGLSQYSRLRQMLEGAKRTQNLNNDLGISNLDAQIKATSRVLLAIERRISTAYNEVTGKTADATTTDVTVLKSDVTTALAGIGLFAEMMTSRTVMDIDFSEAEKLIEHEEGGQERRRLESLTATVGRLDSLIVEPGEIEDIERLIVLAKQRDEAMARVGAASLHELLKEALAVVDGEYWHDQYVCPVCDAKSDQPLKDKLQAKIRLYDEAARLDERLVIEIRNSAGILKLQKLEEDPAIAIEADARVNSQITGQARQSTIRTDDIDRAKKRLISLEERRGYLLKKAQEETESLQTTLPPSLVKVTKILAAAKNFQGAITEFEDSAVELGAKKASLQRLERWKEFIRKAAQLYADAEAKLAEKRIDDIESLCGELFRDFVRGGPDVKHHLSVTATAKTLI